LVRRHRHPAAIAASELLDPLLAQNAAADIPGHLPCHRAQHREENDSTEAQILPRREVAAKGHHALGRKGGEDVPDEQHQEHAEIAGRAECAFEPVDHAAGMPFVVEYSKWSASPGRAAANAPCAASAASANPVNISLSLPGYAAI